MLELHLTTNDLCDLAESDEFLNTERIVQFFELLVL